MDGARVLCSITVESEIVATQGEGSARLMYVMGRYGMIRVVYEVVMLGVDTAMVMLACKTASRDQAGQQLCFGRDDVSAGNLQTASR